MRIVAKILGWASLLAGVFFVLIALLMLFTGKANVAAVFIIPGAALFIAGTNLTAYAKRSVPTDTNRLPKE